MRRALVVAAVALAACARREEDRSIIAFGDSLTEGYEVGPGESYPERLGRLLGRPVLNRGVSGNTTAQGLARLQRDVLDENPRVVLVCLGANDMLRGMPADEQFANLRAIVKAIQAKGALVILIGTEGYEAQSPRAARATGSTPGASAGGPGGAAQRPPAREDYGERYRELARATGAVYVPDLMRGVLGNPVLMRDRIHPNAAGNEKIARRLLAEVGDRLPR
ncbi:MAG TPA: GDSL-type esterase/lipase family protein [Vicinamibacteria bacterium]|nr:GDSL-type esterase/lipase family protein [Vicinamibacteria bacterium]